MFKYNSNQPVEVALRRSIIAKVTSAESFLCLKNLSGIVKPSSNFLKLFSFSYFIEPSMLRELQLWPLSLHTSWPSFGDGFYTVMNLLFWWICLVGNESWLFSFLLAKGQIMIYIFECRSDTSFLTIWSICLSLLLRFLLLS